MITIITGATGQLGRMVVDQLLKHFMPEKIGVSVRDIKKAEDLEGRGVRVRHGDFEDAVSLAKAFEGAAQVLIISPPVGGETAIRQHRIAIDTAKKTGATRILYTSHMGSSPTSLFPPMITHAAAEKALAASGVDFTSLRNGFYASSAVWMLREALKTGELAVPEDGPVAWTSHADLAEVTAIALAKGSLNGVTPNLTASEAIDFTCIAAIASELTGREIRRVVVADDKYRESLAARGTPEEFIKTTMGLFLAARNGEFCKIDPTLERVIGRTPHSMRDVLKATLAHAK